jgi:hypothetical protein
MEKQIYSCDEKALVDSTVGHPERIDRQTNGEPSSFSHQQLSQQALPGETKFRLNNKHDLYTNEECYYPGKYNFIYTYFIISCHLVTNSAGITYIKIIKRCGKENVLN